MDEFNNLIDTGRFLREMVVIEKGQDEPEPHQSALRLVEFPKGHEFDGKGSMDEAGCVHCGYNPWKHEWVKCTRTADFKRDQHLTPAALFKAKVLAVLRDEISGAREDLASDCVVSHIINRIEAIQP